MRRPRTGRNEVSLGRPHNCAVGSVSTTRRSSLGRRRAADVRICSTRVADEEASSAESDHVGGRRPQGEGAEAAGLDRHGQKAVGKELRGFCVDEDAAFCNAALDAGPSAPGAKLDDRLRAVKGAGCLIREGLEKDHVSILSVNSIPPEPSLSHRVPEISSGPFAAEEGRFRNIQRWTDFAALPALSIAACRLDLVDRAALDVADLVDLLEKTSRTFALSIPPLPEPTRREVTVAYLLFRIADTFEDAAPMAPEVRIRALRDFKGLVAAYRRDEAVGSRGNGRRPASRRARGIASFSRRFRSSWMRSVSFRRALPRRSKGT